MLQAFYTSHKSTSKRGTTVTAREARLFTALYFQVILLDLWTRENWTQAQNGSIYGEDVCLQTLFVQKG